MKEECLPYPDQDCTYKENFGESYFKGEGYFDGTSAGYKEGETYDGTTVFTNGCSYSGQYKNGQYDGEGTFIWDFADGYTRLVGTFVSGSPVGQVCTKYFACYETHTIGCWFFTGVMGSFENHAANQSGEGAICYEDGSVYYGDIYFNGDFASGWLRDKTGTIDGSNSSLQVSYLENVGSFIPNNYSTYLIEYVDGSFSKETNFIDGNAIVYVADANHEPYGYITGTWLGWARTGVYTGETITPRDGFTRDLTNYI